MTDPATALQRTGDFDAIVVGGGATGGVASWQLTKLGLRVLTLDSGKPVKKGDYGNQVTNLARQLKSHFIDKNQEKQKFHGGYWETNPEFFADDKQNPYSTPEDKPYLWIRGGKVGGRSHTWGGVTLRFSDYEFKAAKRDGHGADWPIGHDDLAPYYDEIEGFLEAHGRRDGIATLPDGNFREPSELTPAEALLKGAVDKNWPERKVIVSRGIRAARHPGKGEIHTRLSSVGTTLRAAEATGLLTLRGGALVSRILVDDNSGRAVGVEYIDRVSGELHSARAPLVVMCASTIETLRILMLSKSKAHPNGIGASTGLLGRGLMDHIVSCLYFDMPNVKETGGFHLLGSDSFMIPRWVNVGAKSESYMRGFGMWGGIERMPIPPLLRKRGGVPFGFLCAMGEALPYDHNHVRLDDTKKDAWGLPVPYISTAWSENDIAVCNAARAAGAEMIEAAGGVVGSLTKLVRTPFLTKFMKIMDVEWAQTKPGLFVHEVGGARMGTDRATSVTNTYGQLWDAPNILIGDGACWVSSGWQNPTLTEMAICARGCASAVEQMKRREL